MGKSLAAKLNRAILNSSLNLLYPLENRLCSYVLTSAVSLQGGRRIFQGNITRTAELPGTSFRHVHRTLGNLCTQGLLEKLASGYLILDEMTLEEKSAGIFTLDQGL